MSENEINNDEKTYMLGMKYSIIPRNDEERERSKNEVPELFGTQNTYHSTSRTDVTKLASGSRDVWRLMDALKWKTINKPHNEKKWQGLYVTTAMLEGHFGFRVYEEMKKLWTLGGRRGRNFIITHSNKYDSWTDSMRIVSHLNRHTYSDASRHSRKNAYVINYEALCEIWKDNGKRWGDNKNNLDKRNADIHNLGQVAGVVYQLEHDILKLTEKSDALDKGPVVEKEDLVLYTLYNFESGMTKDIAGEIGEWYWERNERGIAAMEAAQRLDKINRFILTGLPSLNRDNTITIKNLYDATLFLKSEPNEQHNRKYGDAWTLEDIPQFSEIALLMETREELKREVEKKLNDYKDMVCALFNGDEEE